MAITAAKATLQLLIDFEAAADSAATNEMLLRIVHLLTFEMVVRPAANANRRGIQAVKK